MKHDGFQILIRYVFLFIAEHFKLFEAAQQFFFGKIVSHLSKMAFHRMFAGMLAENNVLCMDADSLRCQDLIRLLIGQYTVLMNTGFMCKCIFSYNCFIL